MIEEEDEAEEGSDAAWMATFADLMSLLLTFFVLILSFANMDVIKFSAAVDSLHEAFGTADAVEKMQGMVFQSPIDFGSPNQMRIFSLDAGEGATSSASLEAQMREMVKRMRLDNLVTINSDPRGIVVRIIGQLLFDPGSVDLRPESFVLLRELARLVKAIPNPVSIEGHTDDTSPPPGTTNWNLSAGRAITVLRYLETVHGIDPKRMSVAGFASTRPLEPNDNQQNRELNRRVEFVFQVRDGAGDRVVETLQNTAAASN